ncbi:MAG TPA: winged helix DNA-binding domain-containing protein [bacterium]
MTLSDIARYRFSNQLIARQSVRTPADVVAWLGAMQAQDFLGAKWSVGLRAPGVSDATVEQALADRTIIRTWPMRGTLHFVTPDDVRWMLALLTPRVLSASKGRWQALELNDKIFAQSRKVFHQVLRGGKHLTRSEMYQALERAKIRTSGQRGYHLLWRNAQEGLICLGAPRGKQQTFVLLDEWVPAAKPLEREEALAKLVLRYFVSHGPATVKDFVWWSGLTAKDAQAGIEVNVSRLASEVVDAKTYWMARRMSALQSHSRVVQLLPGFDEYILGYTERDPILDPRHARRVYSGLNLLFNPTIVIDGRIQGTWRRVIRKETVDLSLHPFKRLNTAEAQGLRRATQRYGEFLRLRVPS